MTITEILARNARLTPDSPALIEISPSQKLRRTITWKEFDDRANRFANVLLARGIKKGDVVTIYMPMIPEAAVAMLACTRIGAVHSVVFGGFSADALKDRITDSACKILITSNTSLRAGKSTE